MEDRWPTRTLPDYNCEVANPAFRKRRLLGTHQWQSALLVVGLPVTEDWFEMGCHLSPSLISIRLTACCTSIPRKRRGNHKQTNNPWQTKASFQCIAVYSLKTIDLHQWFSTFFLPMDPFSLLFFLVDPFIAIGHKNNHLHLFLPLTDGWTPSD